MCKFEGHTIFIKRDIQPRGNNAKVPQTILAGGLRVYFCLDSCLVYINFAHIQDHDYVLYLCGGTAGIV